MSDITITEKTLEKPLDYRASPEIPEIGWRGLFADYRDLVGPTTEATDNYHFFTFCQILGCTIGRRSYVYHGTKIYPNFYICLIGNSGSAKKDTCWSRAEDLLNRLHAETDDAAFRMYSGIRSYEGLLDELSGTRRVRLIQISELASLMGKAKQDSMSNLIPELTTLFDCKDRIVNVPLSQKKIIEVKEPFLSLIANSTLTWLQKSLTESDIYGGFGNRFMYVTGNRKGPKPFPPRMDNNKLNELVENINRVRDFADDHEEIGVTAETKELFVKYYDGYYIRSGQEGLLSTLLQRQQDFIWKIALLYALMDLSEIIEIWHLEAAIAIGNYLESSVSLVFDAFMDSKGKLKENKLLDFLRSEGKPVSQRQIYRKLNFSANELQAIVFPLLKFGVIASRITHSEKGREITVYEAVT